MRFIGFFLFAALLANADSKNQVFADFTIPLPLQRGDTLILGIVGGWERWDADHRIVRGLALRLRNRRIPHAHVETVENHKLELARTLIRKAFDFNQDGALDEREIMDVRLILFGQSLGGSSVVRLARELAAARVPIRLTLQIDSVGKGDRLIPPNVAEAANLYQRSLPVRGEPRIIAEDPKRTRILCNTPYEYRGKRIPMPGEPWIRRFFLRGHLRMEYDPAVWARAEELLSGALASNATAASK